MQKLCKFIIGSTNHRISSATTCPFNVFGSAWTEKRRRTWHIRFCGNSLQIDKTEDG